MVSSYSPTIGALISARQSAQPVRKADLAILLAAEPHAPGRSSLDSVIEEVDAVKQVMRPLPITTIGNDRDGARVHSVVDTLREKPYSILHLACHGEQDPKSPLQSGFCMRDGKLSVADLMRLNLPQPLLAYLSACETAKGDNVQPDQAVHLAAAMLFVGFRSVVATMW